MADISSEITAIEEAVHGDETRSALVNALNKMNNETLPSVSASDAGKMLVVDADGDWSVASSGVIPIPTDTKTITSNGTHDVTNYASADVDVPNTYVAGDEGKVVDDGALVAQTSRSVSANGTYDTTTNNEVVVNVSGGGTLVSKSITQNGTYDPADDNADGYSEVVVNVSGSGEVQYYDPTVNSNYVSDYEGKIVVSGCWATFCCYFMLSSTPGGYKTLFTIPEAIRPYGFYSFDVGNGGNNNHSYGHVTDDGEIKIFADIAYGFFMAKWFVPKIKQQITYDSTYVSSILYGGIAINGNVGHMSCVIDANPVSSNNWYRGILTIPSAYKPEYVIRPFGRSFSSNPAGDGIGYNMTESQRITSYIRDTIHTVSDGNIDIFISPSRGKYIWLQSEWIIPQAPIELSTMWIMTPDEIDDMYYNIPSEQRNVNHIHYLNCVTQIKNNDTSSNALWNICSVETFNASQTAVAVVKRGGTNIGVLEISTKIPHGKYNYVHVFMEVKRGTYANGFCEALIVPTLGDLIGTDIEPPANSEIMVITNLDDPTEVDSRVTRTRDANNYVPAQVVVLDVSAINFDFYLGFRDCNVATIIRGIYLDNDPTSNLFASNSL